MGKRKKSSLFCFLIILCLSIGLIGCGGPDLGEKITVDGLEVYYKDTVSKEEAQKFVDCLTIVGYVDTDEEEVSFAINKKNDTYEIKSFMKKGFEIDQEVIDTSKSFASEMSMYAFSGAPVDITLCDEEGNTLKTINTSTTIDLGESLFFNNSMLFYTSSIKKEEAQKLGDFLVELEFFTEDPMSLQIDKINDIYTIKLPIKKDAEKDEEFVESLQQVALSIAENIFDDELVEIHLCNDTFETLSAISSIDLTLGKSLTSNGDVLFYTSTVAEEEAQKLLQYLVDQGLYDGSGMLAQINKNYDTYEFRLTIKKGLEQDQEVIDTFKMFSKELSKTIFNGESVDIHLCDDNLNTLRVVVAF
jgi:hypothetical protein